MRVLVSMQGPEEEEEVARPDAEQLGMRVQRFARCALDGEDERKYAFKIAGVAGDVQWLMTAAGGSTFFLTVVVDHTVDQETLAFRILAHCRVEPDMVSSYGKLLLDSKTISGVTMVTHVLDATPCKRLQQVTMDPGEDEVNGTLTKRRRLLGA